MSLATPVSRRLKSTSGKQMTKSGISAVRQIGENLLRSGALGVPDLLTMVRVDAHHPNFCDAIAQD